MKVISRDQTLYRYQLLAVLVVVIMTALLEFIGLVRPLRSLGELFFRPFRVGTTWSVQTAKAPFYYGFNLQKTARRIQDLELRYAEVSAQLGELQALRQENTDLKAMLGSRKLTNSEPVITSPLVSLTQPAIAAGSKEGVRTKQMVLVDETLVGVTTQVSEHQSTVLLLSDNEKQPILAQTESGVQGIVVGDGRRVLLRELPLDVNIQVGERVITTGQEGISRDIFMGRVSSLRSEPSSPVKTAVLEQLVSFYQARVVEVR